MYQPHAAAAAAAAAAAVHAAADAEVQIAMHQEQSAAGAGAFVLATAGADADDLVTENALQEVDHTAGAAAFDWAEHALECLGQLAAVLKTPIAEPQTHYLAQSAPHEALR